VHVFSLEMVSQLINKFSLLVQSKGLYSYLEEPAIGLYLQPVESI